MDTSVTYNEGPYQVAPEGSAPTVGGEHIPYRLNGRAILLLIAMQMQPELTPQVESFTSITETAEEGRKGSRLAIIHLEKDGL